MWTQNISNTNQHSRCCVLGGVLLCHRRRRRRLLDRLLRVLRHEQRRPPAVPAAKRAQGCRTEPNRGAPLTYCTACTCTRAVRPAIV